MKKTQKSKNEFLVDPDYYATEYPYLLIDKEDLFRIVKQVSSIINVNGKRPVSRGLTLRIIDPTHVEVILPNEIYYFKTTIDAKCTLKVGTTIFLDYVFLKKLKKFIPPKILIYLNHMMKYHVRTIKSELPLNKISISPDDLTRLDIPFEITDKVCEVNLGELYNSLNTPFKMINFESEQPYRILSIEDGLLQFKCPMVFAGTTTKLLDIILVKKVVNYLLDATTLTKENTAVTIYNTDSKIDRYALIYDDTMLIIPKSKMKSRRAKSELFNELPKLTTIDYQQVKDILELMTACTYAMGNITLSSEDNILKGIFKLEGGSNQTFTITTLSELKIPHGQQIRLNTKTLLNSLNKMNPNLVTKIGFEYGLFYLVNSEVTIIFVTF